MNLLVITMVITEAKIAEIVIQWDNVIPFYGIMNFHLIHVEIKSTN